MPQDDPSTSAPPEVRLPEEGEPKPAVVDTTSEPVLSPEALAVFESLTPLLVEPKTLIQGLRYLQRRIPDFVQLSIEEERSMARAAHLSPEIYDLGVHTAGAWDQTKDLFGWTGDDLRRRQDVIRDWDAVEREIEVLRSGVHGANLRRKHALGMDIMDLYALARRMANSKSTAARHFLRPYVEELKHAFARMRRKKPRKKE